MLFPALRTVHLLAVIVWIGGMVFAHFFLRPALAGLEPPQRLRLMAEVLRRFFAAVLAASLLALASGAAMLALHMGAGPAAVPVSWHLMAGLGVVMVAVSLHLRFALLPRLQRAVAAADWPAAGSALARIRVRVVFNLALGVLILLAVLL
ncbi:MAG: CopD family protein [Burkholderiales bacterium]|nr:CopD family protein [Burkholderiales bacterium]